jgi:hypothetical protein
MIAIRLSAEDAAFLVAQLTRHLTTVENELVHTEARSMQASLARDYDRLVNLRDRLSREVDAFSAPLGSPQ